MGINKVVINRPTGVEILIDLTMDTVAPETLVKGYTAHGADGEPIVGIYEATSADAEYTVWEKRTIERYVEYYSMEFGESNSTTASVSSFMDSHKKIIYADYSFDENTGVITLSNPLSTKQSSSADQLTNFANYPYYYGDKSNGTTDNTVYKLTNITTSGTSSYNKSYTWEFDKAIVSEHGAYDIAGDLIETIADTNSTAYPDNGVQDGYWYVKAGSGEGGGNTGGTTEVKLQIKSATPSETAQTIKPDTGYDGLSHVVVGAISSNYVGSGVTKLAAKTYTPSTSQQTIASGQYLNGTQTISAVPTETKTITENGTFKPSTGKFFSQVIVNVPTGGGDGLPDVIVAGDTPILADWEGVQSSSLTPTSLGLSLTIPKNGTYRFYVPTSGGSVMSSTQPTLEIYKNGVPSGVTASLPNMVKPYPRRFDVECAEGDVVEVYGTSVKSNSSNVTITALALIACIDK